jgi:DNA-binding PucR family transcriptional regulator
LSVGQPRSSVADHTYTRPVDTDSPQAREGVVAVAAALAGRLAAISDDLQDVIEQEIPALRDDQRVVSMLEASVAENVSTIVHALRYGIDTAGVEAPTSALEYARRLAQRDVDAAALVRAYRLGQARFTRLFVEELHQQTGADQIDGGTTMRAVEQISEYCDRVIGQLLQIYEQERTAWLQNRSAVLVTRVRSILDGERVDIDRLQTALGYRLRRHHLGLILWIDDPPAELDPFPTLDDLADDLARSAGCTDDPLVVLCDETSAWAWLPLASDDWPTSADLAKVVADAPPSAAVAVGAPASGVDGFRRTHRQAISAQVVALAAGPTRARMTPFAEVAPIAMMCADIDSVRAWVAETLGALAIASERNDGLRETARVFLDTGGSYTATGDQLYLHRNTVQYRVRQAEELRGRPFTDVRLDVELALLACHWLGATILQPA